MKTCSIPSCGKKHCANTFCSQHNARFKKYGDPLAVIRSRWDTHVKTLKKCSNPSCSTMVKKGTYCPKCYKRKRLHGDINIVKPRGNKDIWKLGKNGGSKPKYLLDSSILNEWSPALAWLLGWAITDGCVENKTRPVVSWMLKDREPLEIIQKLFKTDKPIELAYKTRRGEKILYYRLRLCGKAIVQKFIELGIEPNKTFTTKIPPTLPKELMWHFLRGVLEGDGCIYSRTKNLNNRDGYIQLVIRISSGNELFLQQIQDVIGFGRIRFVENAVGICYSLNAQCSKAVNFLENAYYNSEGLRLARKYDKWQAFLKSGQYYNVKKLK